MIRRFVLLLSLCVLGFVAPSQLCAQTNLVVNGGFEDNGDGSPWAVEGSVIWTDPTAAHSGTNFLWLGGLTDWTDDAYQYIDVPAGVSSATLSFYYAILSKDSTTVAHDYFDAFILDTNFNLIGDVGDWSNIDGDHNGNVIYQHKTFDLLPYAGTSIAIYFQSTNDSAGVSSMFIDDVSVTTTVATGPADLVPRNVSVFPTSALVGGTVNVSYTVANLGGDTAAASHTKVVIKDSGNNIFSQQTFATASLAGGTSTNESHALALVGASPGSYNVYVTVDANAEAGQTNTANDTSAPMAFTVQSPAGLIINPIYDATITNDPNSATIQNTINAAVQQYETLFSDPITVNILFSKTNTGLGYSLNFVTGLSYSSFLSALSADAKTTNDSVALAHLPSQSVNPVNGNGNMTLTVANMRALGLSGSSGTNYDSHIFLNLSLMNLTRSSIDPNKYDLMAVAQHEIDEALGLGSSLNGLSNGDPSPTGAVHVMDLFRYDQNGARSLNTAATTQAYFSIDGVTDLVRFNQQQGGDFQDWYSPGGQTPRVQDAFATPGATPNLTAELIALDVSGYNLVSAIPVPKIISETTSANTFVLTWTSQTGLKYQVQSKSDLNQSGWTNVGSPVTATGSTTSESFPISTAQQYFRVAVITVTSSIVPKLAPAPMPISIETNYLPHR